MEDYQKQAQDFLEKTGTTIEKKFLKYDIHFAGDKEKRNIWEITLKNKEGTMTFKFGDSIMDSAKFKVSDEGLKTQHKCYALKKLIDGVDKLNSKYMTKQIYNIKYDDAIAQNRVIKGVIYSAMTQDQARNQLKYLEEVEPDNYSLLAGLDVLYEYTFEGFCSAFGYEEDSRSAYKIYNACVKQDGDLRRLFDKKELELLSEIN